MPEKEPQFFKPEESEQFKKPPEKEQEKIIGAARIEAQQQAAKEGLIERLSQGDIDSALKIKDKFNLPEEMVQQAAKERLIEHLSWGYIDSALEIKDKFNLPEEIMKSPRVQQAAKERLIKCLSHGDIDSALEIKDKFNLPEEMVQQVAKERLIKCLSHGDIDSALEIKDKFNLPEEMVQQAAKERLIEHLSQGHIDSALKIKDEFSPNISPQEIIERCPEIADLLARLEETSPKFCEQARKSTEIILTLFNFKGNPDKLVDIVKKNPFLIDAVSNNPRFGSKLLLKYPELDNQSRENIGFLFKIKKEILENNPETSPESLEFRQLMQEKLKNYENNPEILKAIEKSGIDINIWLNYDETRYFNLESGQKILAFSETISTPINRVKETIDAYAYRLKDTLKEYRQELSEFRIPLEDIKEIEEKISQMREELEKAKSENNEKKAQGVEKGIENLQNKMEAVKDIALWDKILNDISSFQQLKNNIFKIQENLIQAENSLEEKLSEKTPSGKTIQELKQKTSSAKEELRNKFGLLENRIENFKSNLPELISPCLGENRTASLTQEIEQSLAEQFSHYNVDRSTLANLFSEKSDQKKEKMESRSMSVFVWARNPDVDLYQGNYSDCCVRIDSQHMGAESTIADYNADLGIQIVNIYDEAKKEPVTAAWCWLGKDKNNKPALVVDNIESNTAYSANYPEQLTKELFDYLKDYAKAIGVKKVVLGKANNDLPTAGELAKLPADSQKYKKIGGYNRLDGYFLEAEDQGVKIIHQARETKKEEIKKEGEKIAKIEFKELAIRNLTQNDFAKVKQLEKKIYQDAEDLIMGQAIVEDIKSGNGLGYSIIIEGKRGGNKTSEVIGYLVAVEDKTDEGDSSVYLEDIALVPEAQSQKIGWQALENLIIKLKEKARKENKPVLLDMHLRENSQKFMERHRNELEQIGVKLIEEVLVADYYDEGEDALYKVYEVKAE